MKTKLLYINLSHDPAPPPIVIFQPSTASDRLAQPVAWKVIQRCGYECSHPFVLTDQTSVRLRDRKGNCSAPVDVRAGQTLEIRRGNGARQLRVLNESRAPAELNVVNRTENDIYSIEVLKLRRPVAVRSNLAPSQLAAFRFAPFFCIGANPSVNENDILTPQLLTEFDTELRLPPTARSAEIVMTGGGAGPRATAFKFALERLAY